MENMEMFPMSVLAMSYVTVPVLSSCVCFGWIGLPHASRSYSLYCIYVHRCILNYTCIYIYGLYIFMNIFVYVNIYVSCAQATDSRCATGKMVSRRPTTGLTVDRSELRQSS